MHLDLRTLYVATILSLAAATASIFYLYWVNRGMRGLLCWGLGSASILAGLTLIALRGVIPDLFSIVLANSSLALGFGLFWESARRFADKPSRLWPSVLGALALAPIMAWFRFVHNDLNLRSTAITALLALYASALTVELLRGQPRYGRPQRVLGWLFAFAALFYVVWTVYIARAPLGADFFTSGQAYLPLHLLSLLYASVFAVGIVMMISERLRLDLAQARDKADRASRAKSEFLARMSHELRTPLNGVLGMLELLRRTPLTEEQRECVEASVFSSRNLLGIINEILDFSRIEAGRMDAPAEVFDLRRLLTGTLSPFRILAQGKNLELVLECPDDPCLLRGHARYLSQVLGNLVANALKYTDRGRVAVRVERDPSPEDDAVFLRCTIRDTGQGIAADRLESIFEPFTQATSDPRRGGTGLGLSIARRLVDQMQGDIQVQSTPGKGSCFTFTARFTRPGPHEVPDSPPGRPAGTPPDRDGLADIPPLRILLAEDYALNSQFLVRLLEQHGHRVRSVEDGRQAVQAMTEEPFDLVLMDVLMPELDGLAATRLIRAEGGAAARTPIVALTAYALPGDRERILAQGLDDYLTKPLAIPELARVLSRFAPLGPHPAPHRKPDGPDWDAIGRLLGGSREALEAYCALARDTLPKEMASLAEVRQRGDLRDLARLAHSLRSTALSLGSKSLAATLLRLEQAATQGDRDAATVLADQAHEDFALLLQALASPPPN